MLALAATAFVGCSDNDDDDIQLPTLEVTPQSLTFDETGGAQTFQIVTTGEWKITGADGQSWMAVTPKLEGTGNQTITVTVGADAAAHTAELKVTVYANVFGVTKEVETKTVRITQTAGELPSDEVIYQNNFDKEKAVQVNNQWPFLDQTEVWKNADGTGNSTVTYTSEHVSVRTSGKLSGGYDGASGENKLFFGTLPASFTIDNITLPSGKLNYKLVFGGAYSKRDDATGTYDNIFKPESFLLTLGNGTGWSGDVTYKKIGGSDTQDPYWVQYEASFTLKEPVEKLSIRFSAEIASGFALDDVKLTEGLASDQVISFDGSNPNPNPNPGEAMAITIPEIIAKLTTTQTVLDATNDRVFEAVVVTDVAGGNVNKNNLQVMTPGATTAKNGITLYGSGKYTNPEDAAFTFQKGDKVKVTLKAGKAQIVNYSGLYEITGKAGEEWVVIEKTGTATITPIEIGVDELADYQAMVVTFQNATAPATAAVWSTATEYGKHTFAVGRTNLNVFIQAGMPGLAGQEYVAGATGSLTGYATVYQNAPQVCPQTPADVADFMSSAPAITGTDPASLAFSAASETKTLTVTTANANGATITATSDNTHFSPSVNGMTVSVVAAENTTAAPITGVLTLKLMLNGATVDTKTVEMIQSKPSSGNETQIVADFSVEADYPTDFPKLSANKTVEAKTFAFNGYDYTFAGSEGNGYYMAYGNNSAKTDPYIINGKQGAYIELPAVAGKALATVTLTTRNGASKSVMVGIYDNQNQPVAGGEAIKLAQDNGQMEYTYNLTGTTPGTKYRIYIASAHNAQFVKLEMTYN